MRYMFSGGEKNRTSKSRAEERIGNNLETVDKACKALNFAQFSAVPVGAIRLAMVDMKVSLL